MRLPVALITAGLLSACGLNAKEAGVVDDEITRLGNVAGIGIPTSSVAAIDSAAKKGDLLTLHRLIAPGIRSGLEVAQIKSDVKALQARWKTAR